jgi:tRNA uridine 5-carboxymethylaminomethyl modification enzyme
VAVGCVGTERAVAFARKKAALGRARQMVRELAATPAELARHGITINQDGVRRPVSVLLGYPGLGIRELGRIWPELLEIGPEIAEQLEIEGRYAGYLERQEADIRAFRRDEDLRLPADLDYDTIGSLSAEVRMKLRTARPATLGAAARISGVTPAALTALLRHVRRREAPRGRLTA